MSFNPEMLVLAREARGLSQSELARRMDLTQAAISKWEASIIVPTPEHVAQFAGLLEFPISFFGQSARPYGFGTPCLYHRRRKSAGILVLRRLQALANILRLQLERLLALDERDDEVLIPQIDLDVQPFGPAQAADVVRRTWKLPFGPIRNVVQTLEEAGGYVFLVPFGNTELDAVSQWTPGMPPVFLVNAQMPVDRRRLSLAHELGHLVLHASPASAQEDEADQFAGAFLMPEDEVAGDLADLTIPRLAHLKSYWRASMASILVRAKHLGSVDADRYRSLWIQMSRLGYRRHEPVQLPDERPTRVQALVESVQRRLGCTVQQVAAMIDAPCDEFEQRFVVDTPHLRLLN